MGFERHTIHAAGMPIEPQRDGAALRSTASIVTPLRPADTSREPDVLRLARQMRGEWRKERYSRLADR
ncbi:MAG: hypothetical protein K2Y27_18190 [Xanthobacteraceae bacterium]|nr:hypothetical protein [Xanthobacteraceae bacterium]